MYRIRRETGKGMRDAMQILADAVEDDPSSSLAWAGLAYGYGEWGHMARDEKIPWYPWLLKWYPATKGFQSDPRVIALAEDFAL